jgi:hypothetical protein
MEIAALAAAIGRICARVYGRWRGSPRVRAGVAAWLAAADARHGGQCAIDPLISAPQSRAFPCL